MEFGEYSCSSENVFKLKKLEHIAIRLKNYFFNSKKFLGCFNQNILVGGIFCSFNQKFGLNQVIFYCAKENFLIQEHFFSV